jgi:2-keto-4-pentenoate hydratase/2-oxohepta-3-ene-1,7-dioic acid hydratase in catechol pathway
MQRYLHIQNSDEKFQVNNVYCIGKNYLDHIREMGGNKPDDLPTSVNSIYKNKGWISWSDWLGK